MARPALLTSDRIAEAALDIGMERATIRGVADRLGVSVPGLYHHVRNRKDLLALAAAHSLQNRAHPNTEGRSWKEWLFDFARETFDMLLDQPGMITQAMSGDVDIAAFAKFHNGVIDALKNYGFGGGDAAAIYEQLIAVIFGAGALEIGFRNMSPDTKRELFGTEGILPASNQTSIASRSDEGRFVAVRLVLGDIVARYQPMESS